jgi:hypothetical protein
VAAFEDPLGGFRSALLTCGGRVVMARLHSFSLLLLPFLLYLSSLFFDCIGLWICFVMCIGSISINSGCIFFPF